MLSFPFNIYLGSFVGACAVSLLGMPLWRRWAYHTGLVDDPGRRKIHDRPIALAGGLAVLSGLILPAALAGIWIALTGQLPIQPTPDADLGHDTFGLLSYGFARRGGQLTALLFGAVAMTALGWWDDKYELAPAKKLAGQLIISFVVAAAGVRITLFVPNVAFSYLVTILWIVTLTNALNFMDNMNGLCAGLGVIGTGCYALTAGLHGHYLVAVLALSACGALAGFLPYNFPKATIFLGDAGSHLVGYLLATLAILPHFYSRQNPKALAVLSPLLILAVPLVDLAWVVILRWRAGRPVYIGDTNHLSHRLVRSGWSRSQAVLIIWFLAALCGGLSFAL